MSGSHDLTGAALPPLTVVLGGARSGKSRLAENLVTATQRPRFYLATAEAWDDEMRERIDLHRQDRGPEWTTVDAPLDLCSALSRIPSDGCVLLDCATLWLTNHLLAEHDLEAEAAGLLTALARCPAPVVVVSNEVGWSIVPENVLARRFRDEQGRLNQKLAAQADLVLGVMAGLPIVLKGRMPARAA
ncbi:bifunctional adenosylcobinamide kinase/adenosylcobinamide-phosphate guanylyltransferase [Cereibacter changlensis]|uniref:Bifunctional adenosylcobalamin biosynthesis protein n=1 Tax=Cereibacter changlensis TaxID=402884 RepID=A0A4U0YRV9_9RHOB|nr:bifunctional adenosylcobinamide kinase/adenosylcobinamide-phosphate guanylyltransferase [Cereibacter changlensis]TKA94238.1 bifunctional adenosylcobinamide kinase/adenosylcobinamide-phosphate guanylyltransferase [Cereibacter changlensis]